MSTRLWAQNAVSSTRVGATPTDSLSSIGSINTNLPLANTKSLLSAYGRTYALSGRQVLLSLASSSLAIRYNRFSMCMFVIFYFYEIFQNIPIVEIPFMAYLYALLSILV